MYNISKIPISGVYGVGFCTFAIPVEMLSLFKRPVTVNTQAIDGQIRERKMGPRIIMLPESPPEIGWIWLVLSPPFQKQTRSG